MKGRVYVAGTGVISAIGNSIPETLKSFENHSSGIGKVSLFDTIHENALPVGEVKIPNTQLADNLSVNSSLSRTALLGIQAAREAVAASRVNVSKWRTGLISATTVGGMDKTENFFVDFLKNPSKGRLRNVVHHECGSSTELIADDLGVSGFISTINTACSSSVNAIAP